MRFLICLLAVAMLIPSAFAAANTADLEARRKALNDLLHEQWEYNMRTSPLYASILGDKRYNDKIDDFSQAAIDADLEQSRVFLKSFEAIDTTGFPEQEALNKQLMVRDLKNGLEGARFKPWEMPVSQQDGIHIDAPQLVSILAFDSVKDYEDYITRLKLLPTLFDQTIIQMKKGMAEGRMQPRILLEKVVTQANGIATTPAEQSPFSHPFDKFPNSFSEADRKRLREEGLAAVRDSIIPAYVKFTAFVRDEYAPKGRTEPGAWSLPDGDAWYAYRVKQSTTTDLTPEEIHQIGLAQVKEIEERMLGVAKQMGYKDVKSFNAACDADPKLHAHSRQEILDLYQKYIDQMYTKLPEMFGRLPKARLDRNAGRGISRKGSVGGSLSGWNSRWFAARPCHGQHGRLRQTYFVRRRNHCLSRGRSGTSLTDHDRARVARAASVPATRVLHGLHRRVGAVFGTAGQGSRVLSGSLQLLRPLAG